MSNPALFPIADATPTAARWGEAHVQPRARELAQVRGGGVVDEAQRHLVARHVEQALLVHQVEAHHHVVVVDVRPVQLLAQVPGVAHHRARGDVARQPRERSLGLNAAARSRVRRGGYASCMLGLRLWARVEEGALVGVPLAS